MSTTEPSATERTGTAEDVERLARDLMGWKRGPWWKTQGGAFAASSSWDPFESADADVQVLERVREVWLAPGAILGSPQLWPLTRFHGALMSELDSHGHGGPRFLSYHTGDYARAALAVLKEMGKMSELLAETLQGLVRRWRANADRLVAEAPLWGRDGPSSLAYADAQRACAIEVSAALDGSPLVAAPPEDGRPTWEDLEEAFELVRMAVDGNQWNEWHRRARALLLSHPQGGTVTRPQISELQMTSNALRWLVQMHDNGAVPGELRVAAHESYLKLDELRRKLFNPRAVEQSIAAAWQSEEP